MYCRVLISLHTNSKTFLARLCEQAERYDGEPKTTLNACSHAYKCERDGQLHEGGRKGMIWSK